MTGADLGDGETFNGGRTPGRSRIAWTGLMRNIRNAAMREEVPVGPFLVS